MKKLTRDAGAISKPRKPIPYEFVLDALSAVSPRTRPMFGCLAVYVGPRIVLVLREKRKPTADGGVWLATTCDHHESLSREFPNMRSIQVFGKEVTGWQVLPGDARNEPIRRGEACLAQRPAYRSRLPPPRRTRRSRRRRA